MLSSLQADMMKLCHGQRWHCENCRMVTRHCVSLLQAARFLDVTRRLRDWRHDYSRLTRRSEFPTFSRMYLALTGIQNTRRSMQMLCERRGYLSDGLPTLRGTSARALRSFTARSHPHRGWLWRRPSRLRARRFDLVRRNRAQ